MSVSLFVHLSRCQQQSNETTCFTSFYICNFFSMGKILRLNFEPLRNVQLNLNLVYLCNCNYAVKALFSKYFLNILFCMVTGFIIVAIYHMNCKSQNKNSKKNTRGTNHSQNEWNDHPGRKHTPWSTSHYWWRKCFWMFCSQYT